MALNADTQASKFAALPADVYTLRLTDIEEKEGQFGPYWIWKFEAEDLPEPEEEGVEWKTFHWFFTDNRTNPEVSRKNKNKSPRVAAAALMGRAVRNDEFVEGYEYEDLIGKKCRGTVSLGEKDGVPRNNVEALLPLRGQSQRASVPPATVQEPLFEPEVDDIPFEVDPEPAAAVGKTK